MQLLEIHDRPWFPRFMRDLVTDDLETILNLVNVYQAVARQLRSALKDAGTSRVVDLCSGGGGPWPWLYQAFESGDQPPVHIWLSDKYPNAAAFARTRNASGNRIHFRADPIDATNIPGDLDGFRTFFSSFHHFPPPEARAILQDAVARRQGIGIFEAPGRHALTILLVLLIPVADWLLAPSVRPFRWMRMVWTYLIPVIPLVLLIDGMLSCLRVYSPEELRQMASSVDAGKEYHWEIGVEKGGIFGVPITYLTGYPTAVLRAGRRYEDPAGTQENQSLKPATI
jgi:hypothetical protein